MIIGITPEIFYRNEHEAISSLIEAGMTRIHVRKPNTTNGEVEGLLKSMDLSVLPLISVHYHHETALRCNVGGLHESTTALVATSGLYVRSCSCHSFNEITGKINCYDYLFLSPVFNSISKKGYKQGFYMDELRLYLANLDPGKSRVVALGGVCAGNVNKVKEIGFHGFALLGALWSINGNSIDIKKTVQNFKIMANLWNQ